MADTPTNARRTIPRQSDYYAPDSLNRNKLYTVADMLTGGMLGAALGTNKERNDAAMARDMDLQLMQAMELERQRQPLALDLEKKRQDMVDAAAAQKLGLSLAQYRDPMVRGAAEARVARIGMAAQSSARLDEDAASIGIARNEGETDAQFGARVNAAKMDAQKRTKFIGARDRLNTSLAAIKEANNGQLPPEFANLTDAALTDEAAFGAIPAVEARAKSFESIRTKNDQQTATQKLAESLAAAREELFNANGERETDRKRWNKAVSTYRALSKDLKDVDPEVEALLQGAGARRQALPNADVGNLISSFNIANSLSNAARDINSVATKLGNGDTDAGLEVMQQVLGLGKEQVNEVLRRFVNDDGERNQINNVLQQLRLAAADYRKSKYGAALTGNEIENFKNEFGDAGQADFLRAALNFSRVQFDNLEGVLDNYDAAGFNIPPKLRQRYEALRKQYQPAADKQGVEKADGGSAAGNDEAAALKWLRDPANKDHPKRAEVMRALGL